MKRVWIFLLLGLLWAMFSLSACCDDDDVRPCTEEGVIIGVDLRECACCGGFFIKTGGDTLRALTLPDAFNSDFDLEETPLPVYLEWTAQDPLCLGDEIILECIARR